MRGLSFFQRTSDPRCWNIAGFHSPRSRTWSWVLSFHRNGDERRGPLWWAWRTHDGLLRWGLRLHFVGIVTWQRQRRMPLQAPR